MDLGHIWNFLMCTCASDEEAQKCDHFGLFYNNPISTIPLNTRQSSLTQQYLLCLIVFVPCGDLILRLTSIWPLNCLCCSGNNNRRTINMLMEILNSGMQFYKGKNIKSTVLHERQTWAVLSTDVFCLFVSSYSVSFSNLF